MKIKPCHFCATCPHCAGRGTVLEDSDTLETGAPPTVPPPRAEALTVPELDDPRKVNVDS